MVRPRSGRARAVAPRAGEFAGQRAAGRPPRTPAGPSGRNTAQDRAAAWHGVRIAAWGLLFLGLVAGFIAWLVWTPVRTPVLVAVVTADQSPLPPNAWAQEDVERLQRPRPAGSAEMFADLLGLERVGPGRTPPRIGGHGPRRPEQGSGGRLSRPMPGAVNGDGEPCLVPPAPRPWKAANGCASPVAATTLSEGPCPKDAPARKTLLILDATRMGSNWNIGLLYNSFAERLPAVVQEVNVPNLYVLNSTGTGQVGWAAAELRGSVFGYFLAQGLSGARRRGGVGKP